MDKIRYVGVVSPWLDDLTGSGITWTTGLVAYVAEDVGNVAKGYPAKFEVIADGQPMTGLPDGTVLMPDGTVFVEVAATVIDGLTSTSAVDALSANQGRVLKAAHDALVGVVSGLGTGGGGASYTEVANFSALPASPAAGTTCIVLQPQGVWLVNRKPAGLYRFTAGAWVYLGEVPDGYFVDNVARFFDNADASKQLAFELGSITPGNVRTLTVPDKSGTIATLSDLAGGGVTVEDVLTSTSAVNALSAARGKALKDAADALAVTVAGKATAAQGAKADTALQPGALPAGTTIPLAQVTGAGTAAAQASTAFEAAGAVSAHAANTSNPHATTKAQVGLGNVDNTSDLGKPISTAAQTALAGKQDSLISGTNIRTINGQSVLGSGDLTVAGAGSGANLSWTASPTGAVLASDTGTDATLTLADATNAGLMAPAQVTKLSGVAAGATANSADATLLNRANHTGTQLAATISDSTAAGRALLTAADAAAQRTALGLGTAALQASSAFATSTQGGKADTALQPGVLPAGTTLPAAQVSDSTAAGRAVLTAATAGDQRAAMGLPRMLGVPVAVGGATTLSAASHDGAVLHCTGTPTLTINTGLGASFSVDIRGAVAFAGSATLTDERTAGATYPFASLVPTATADSYVLVGSKT